jgi:hypothetical protein
MRKNKVWRAYQEAQYHSNERGIQFLFTFEEWVKVWKDELGPHWFKKRGRYKGQFVMARFGDKGPYAVGNVKCVLVEQNHSERKANGVSTAGEKHWQSKITDEQAKAIYLAVGSESQIGRKYGIHAATVGDIKRGKTWGHVTIGLGPSPRLPAKRKGVKLNPSRWQIA